MRGASRLVDRRLRRADTLQALGSRPLKPAILTGIVVFHLLALLACTPWLFSWSGLAWAVGGIYLFGALGINIGYHRLLTHRGFSCPRWLEHAFSVLGMCCWQGRPMKWVAIHRMHHQHSDQPNDPHSPRRGFLWSHMGWFLVSDSALDDLRTYKRYVRDLFRDSFYQRLERRCVRRAIHGAQWMAFFGAGSLVGVLGSGSLGGGLQLGLSWLAWGVFVRTTVVWHITWSVNSITHVWGYRNFDTSDDSRNNWLVALLSHGEGWHNNHHALPRCVAHGRRWWELDVSYWTIRALERGGLAWDVVMPGAATSPIVRTRHAARSGYR
jgi:stearoyl-CoA desaturase (delta-9 desaturase)